VRPLLPLFPAPLDGSIAWITMVWVSEDVKLDFKDVLIRPKRSTLRSRAQVDLTRTYIFKHSKREWTGVPVMAANM
jgi:hypothetical protein